MKMADPGIAGGRLLKIQTKELRPSDIERIGEIDRSEEIGEIFIHRDGALRLTPAPFSVPQWKTTGSGEYDVPALIDEWKHYLDEGGTLIGAIEAESLVGFLIYAPNLAPLLAQLAVLHVSRPYRRQGLAKRLTMKCIELARNDGATELYVSATPTRGTIEFYQSLGFELADNVNSHLFELEPEDIHMTMKL